MFGCQAQAAQNLLQQDDQEKTPGESPEKKKNEGEFRSGGANFVFRRKAPPLIFLDRPDARAAASAAWASADILAAHGSMADSTIHISEALVGPRSGSLRGWPHPHRMRKAGQVPERRS